MFHRYFASKQDLGYSDWSKFGFNDNVASIVIIPRSQLHRLPRPVGYHIIEQLKIGRDQCLECFEYGEIVSPVSVERSNGLSSGFFSMASRIAF